MLASQAVIRHPVCQIDGADGCAGSSSPQPRRGQFGSAGSAYPGRGRVRDLSQERYRFAPQLSCRAARASLYDRDHHGSARRVGQSPRWQPVPDRGPPIDSPSTSMCSSCPAPISDCAAVSSIRRRIAGRSAGPANRSTMKTPLWRGQRERCSRCLLRGARKNGS